MDYVEPMLNFYPVNAVSWMIFHGPWSCRRMVTYLRLGRYENLHVVLPRNLSGFGFESVTTAWRVRTFSVRVTIILQVGFGHLVRPCSSLRGPRVHAKNVINSFLPRRSGRGPLIHRINRVLISGDQLKRTLWAHLSIRPNGRENRTALSLDRIRQSTKIGHK